MIKERIITVSNFPVTRGDGDIIIKVFTDANERTRLVDIRNALNKLKEDYEIMYANAQCPCDVMAIEKIEGVNND